MIHWPQTITYTINAGSFADAWRPAIEQAVETWDAVTGYSFAEVPLSGTLAFAPLDDVLAAFGLGGDPLAVNVTVTSSQDIGAASYVGLDGAGSWDSWVIALHEIGHMFGLTDRPLATGDQSLYGYIAPHPTGLTADAIEWVQQDGADDGNNEITVTGSALGRVRGGGGDDTIHGSDAASLLYGNQGADILDGYGGTDTLYGGQDSDRLSGGSDADVLYGNLGSDTLSGGTGADWLHGGQGDDVLYGGAGDTLFGGLGADTLWVHPLTIIGSPDSLDTIMEWMV